MLSLHKKKKVRWGPTRLLAVGIGTAAAARATGLSPLRRPKPCFYYIFVNNWCRNMVLVPSCSS